MRKKALITAGISLIALVAILWIIHARAPDGSQFQTRPLSGEGTSLPSSGFSTTDGVSYLPVEDTSSISESQMTVSLDEIHGEIGLLDPSPIIKTNARVTHKPYTPQLADSILDFAHEQMGLPYEYAHRGPSSFDCSGFIFYVFGRFGLSLEPSSAAYDTFGISLPYEQARKGDIIVFTGTNKEVRKPGHIGIVMTMPGEPVQFIHASSGKTMAVTVSEVESTNYKDRFLSIRRVLR